jgi:hypothetical protein
MTSINTKKKWTSYLRNGKSILTKQLPSFITLLLQTSNSSSPRKIVSFLPASSTPPPVPQSSYLLISPYLSLHFLTSSHYSFIIKAARTQYKNLLFSSDLRLSKLPISCDRPSQAELLKVFKHISTVCLSSHPHPATSSHPLVPLTDSSTTTIQ